MIVSAMLISSVDQGVWVKLHWLEFWQWLSIVIPTKVMESRVETATAVLGFGEERRR
jgi:hypothetical protein